jgi:hypothetical protein
MIKSLLYNVTSGIIFPSLKKMFPTFLSGGAILTHISVVRRFQIAFPYIKIINLDDVYVAIVAHKLNITLLNNKRFAIEEKKRTDVDNIMSSCSCPYIVLLVILLYENCRMFCIFT